MAENARDELDRAASRLEELENIVPARATAFHDLRRDTLNRVKIRTPVHAWRLLRAPDLQARLSEAREVAALGEKLAGLLRECDSLSERINAVENLVRSCPDPTVSRAADFHLAPHRKTLHLIGTGIDSNEALEPAQKRIEELRAILDGVTQAVPLFSEGMQIHRRLTESEDLGAAAIAADLKRWRAEFLAAPQPAGWLEGVAAALGAHRSRLLANQTAPETPPPPPPVSVLQESPGSTPAKQPVPAAPNTPPVTHVTHVTQVQQRFSLAEIEDLLSESREWANALTGDIDEVRPLADRKRRIERDSHTTETINELGDDVRLVRDRLQSSAVEKARQAGETFNRWIAIYTERCGSHPDLKALSQTVQSDRLALPEDYSDFEENLNKAQAKFRARANNDQTKLHEALCATVSSLRNACETARRGRRSAEVDRKLIELEKSLPTPAKLTPQPAMQSIEDLGVCLGIERVLRSLEQQSLKGARSIETRHDSLTNRLRPLQRLLECLPELPELEVSLDPIQNVLENTAKWPVDALLDQCDSELSRLESLLEAAEKKALAGAENKAKDLRIVFEGAELELAALTTRGEPFEFPEPQPSDPAGYIDLLDRARKYESELQIHVAAAIENICERLPSLAQQVRDVSASADSERSGNGRIAASLLTEYGELPTHDTNILALSQLRQWTQQVEVFIYSIQRAKHDTQNEVSDLRSRLNALRQRGGDAYYPQLVERVKALVAGVDSDTLLLDNARLQLAEARRLLDALERDALHRISDEVENARSRIDLEMKTTHDPEFVSKAKLVLRELERNGDHNLPPPAVVRQLWLLKERALRGATR